MEPYSLGTVSTAGSFSVRAPSNTPPASTQGTQRVLACAIGDAPTGAWAGHAGRVAKAYDPGITGYVFQWDIVDVPEFTVFTESNVWYKLVAGSWITLAPSVLTRTRTMVASEILYIRLGLYPVKYIRGQNSTYRRLRLGNGFLYQISATKRNLIVAGP
jgi:hypothetical protein